MSWGARLAMAVLFLQGAVVLLQVAVVLLQGAVALLQGAIVLLQVGSALLQGASAVLQGAGGKGKRTWAWRMLSVMRVPPQPASVPRSTGPKMVPG